MGTKGCVEWGARYAESSMLYFLPHKEHIISMLLRIFWTSLCFWIPFCHIPSARCLVLRVGVLWIRVLMSRKCIRYMLYFVSSHRWRWLAVYKFCEFPNLISPSSLACSGVCWCFTVDRGERLSHASLKDSKSNRYGVRLAGLCVTRFWYRIHLSFSPRRFDLACVTSP